MICEKKHYPSRKAAKEVARKRSKLAGKKLTVYQCAICHDTPWHLTSANSTNRRTLREMNNKSSVFEQEGKKAKQ